jgi:hypothetical protein
MIYLFLIVMAALVLFIFYKSTRQYHSWDQIKDRWFRAGIDNGMAFASKKEGGDEIVRLNGIYNDCDVILLLIKGERSRSLIKVGYPQRLKEKLDSYPKALFDAMSEALDKHEDLKFEGKRINPRVVEQVITLREIGLRGRFNLRKNEIRFEQNGLLFDPSPLFPILDEIVITVSLLADNIEHLLVK